MKLQILYLANLHQLWYDSTIENKVALFWWGLVHSMEEAVPMYSSGSWLSEEDGSITLVNACFTLTEQYRMVLSAVGREQQLSENEMLVLVHLAMHPDARTQKQLQGTNLHLSISSICRMVESLRRKGFLTTELDMNDRRSWIIHLEERGRQLAQQFQIALHARLQQIFGTVPSFDLDAFADTLSRAAQAVSAQPFAC